MKKEIKREDYSTIITNPGDPSLHGMEQVPLHKWYAIDEFHSICLICGMEMMEVKKDNRSK